MIYYVIATKNITTYSTYIQPFLEKFSAECRLVTNQVKDVEESIFIKYNAGIEYLLKESINDDDIIAFIHEDIKLIDEYFVEKVESVFNTKKDVGLLGVIGTSLLSESCCWWRSSPDNLRGQIIQENNEGGSRRLIKGPVGYYDDIVAVDGLCFFIRGKVLKEGIKFDDKSYDWYHFYDIDVCMQVLKSGWKIAVADILIQHKSIGVSDKDEKWTKARNTFFDKWSKEMLFPLSVDSFKNKNIINVEI